MATYIGAAALGGVVLHSTFKRSQTPQEVIAACNASICPPQGYEIWIDTPINTRMRNDRSSDGTLAGAYHYVKRQYEVETATSTAVRELTPWAL